MNLDEVKNIFLENSNTIITELSQAIRFVKIINKIASIPDKLFMNKIEKYCRGIVSISEKERQEYVEKIGRESFNKESVFILGVINKIEELSKIDILVKLFEAKVNEIIDDKTYRRMVLQVDRTMFSDILFLKNNIDKDNIEITSEEEEGLLANGWMVFSGVDGGTATKDGSALYSYTKTAKMFCHIIFSIDI